MTSYCDIPKIAIELRQKWPAPKAVMNPGNCSLNHGKKFVGNWVLIHILSLRTIITSHLVLLRVKIIIVLEVENQSSNQLYFLTANLYTSELLLLLNSQIKNTMQNYNLGHFKWKIKTTPPPNFDDQNIAGSTCARIYHCFWGEGATNFSFYFIQDCP